MPAKNHVHTYRRINGEKGIPRFQCTDHECSHVMPANMLVGRKAICPYDFEEFIITRRMLRLAMPHCGCLSGKINNLSASVNEDKETLKVAENLVEKLLKGDK